MTEDAYRDLIGLVSGLMDEARCGDLIDERLYTVTLDGEPFVLPPQKRLYEMLQAFERRLALFDRAVLDNANARIRDALNGDWPGRVLVELAREDRRARPVFDLAEMPDLSRTRGLIQELLLDIARDDGASDETERLT